MSSDPEADQEYCLQMDAVQSPDELERDKQCELPVSIAGPLTSRLHHWQLETEGVASHVSNSTA